MAAPPQFISRRRRRGSEGVVSPLCGNEFYMLWRSCIGPPRQPKLALSLPIKGPSFCRLTVVGATLPLAAKTVQPRFARGNAPLSPPTAVLPPKGETTHYILRVAGAPSKCVRCAPRRGKSALRFPMESYGTLLSIHSSTAKRGERWWRQPPKGDAFPRPKGGLPVFPRAKPSCKGFLILAPQAPTTTL